MASSLTFLGEELMLRGDGVSDGSLARLATAVILYDDTSTPAKDGTGFVEVANGNGYVTGGQAIVVGDWAYASAPSRIVLADQTWTATTGGIADIAGAALIDGSGNVLAWFDRASALTLNDGDSLTLDDLTIRLP